MRLRLTELSMQQLRRMMASAAQSLTELQAHSQHRTLAEQQESQPSSSSAPTSATAEDHCTRETVRSGAPASMRDKACMLLTNCSPVDLCFGQLGTDEQIMLASGAGVGYNWHSAPGLDPNARKLLHVTSRAAISLCGAYPSEQGNSRGNSRAVMKQEGQTPADDSSTDVQWSEAFEGMAESTAIVSVPVQDGFQALLSVQTTQVASPPSSQRLHLQYVCAQHGKKVLVSKSAVVNTPRACMTGGHHLADPTAAKPCTYQQDSCTPTAEHPQQSTAASYISQ